MQVYLVTGAAGFVGSHICEELLTNTNNIVIGIDNFYSGNKDTIDFLRKESDSFIFYELDIRQHDEISKVIQEHNVKYIFHEAAIASVQISVENPLFTNDVNIKGSLSVLEAARKNDVKRFIFASSAAVFGDEPTLPKNEKSITKPISPYGLEKLIIEQYMELYSEQYGLECIALRYFNVYGPRQDPHSEYSGVISIFDNRIKQDLPVKIYGDGEQYRDFIYVKDIVDINITLMHSHLKNKFSIFCAGSSVKTTINELVKILFEKYNKPIYFEEIRARDGDIRGSVADNKELNKYLKNYLFSDLVKSISSI
ncbi:NAD-dependent epimerase/dehydratase family protein [Acinetobacter terrestris]|uniref:NAD-dependent epimerase/dehydratase family protein n=1 Tax=Acinetobacter terrestris TaxID=2529843 RepID=UPI0035265721